VSVSISGFGYTNSGGVSGPGYTISSGPNGVNSVTGSGSLPGKVSGTATVNVSITKYLYWGFGQISVSDPTAGINLTGYAVFGPAPAKFGNSSTVTGSWFVYLPNRGWVSYAITATVTDNA